jgi:hypothetical protein
MEKCSIREGNGKGRVCTPVEVPARRRGSLVGVHDCKRAWLPRRSDFLFGTSQQSLLKKLLSYCIVPINCNERIIGHNTKELLFTFFI